MKDLDLDLPDPKLVNPERYVAAVSSFQGCDIELSSEDVALFAGTDLEDELDDLVDFGILYETQRGDTPVYRPRDEYALALSKMYKEMIFSEYADITEFLDDNQNEMFEGL